jgi:hypothetical protein
MTLNRWKFEGGKFKKWRVFAPWPCFLCRPETDFEEVITKSVTISRHSGSNPRNSTLAFLPNHGLPGSYAPEQTVQLRGPEVGFEEV